MTQELKGLKKYYNTVHTPGKNFFIIFMFDGVAVIEILLFNRKKQKKMNNMANL